MKTTLTITSLLLFLIGTPPAAHAQDCATKCEPCGAIGKMEGRNYSEDGEHSMDCVIAPCASCDFSIADTGPGADDILRRLSSATSLELVSLVEENRDRLLLNPSRNLVVVRQGTSCNVYALGGLMTVGTKRMKELEELGVPLLEDFLRSEGSLSGREYGSS